MLAIHFTPPALTAAKYDEIIRRLRAVGAGNPPGREYHVCFGSADKLEVLDVWTTAEAFQQFTQTLMPILASLGVDPGQPRIEPARNTIVPTVATV